MNKRGFIDLDILEEINPLAYILGIAAAPITWWYLGYMGYESFLIKILMSSLSVVIGTIVANLILNS